MTSAEIVLWLCKNVVTRPEILIRDTMKGLQLLNVKLSLFVGGSKTKICNEFNLKSFRSTLSMENSFIPRTVSRGVTAGSVGL